MLPGVYSGSGVSRAFTSDGVVLEALGEAVIIGSPVDSGGYDRLTIRGFTFKNTSNYGIAVSSNDVVIEQCRFLQCPSKAINRTGGYGARIRYNVFVGCAWGHYAGSATGGIIENCTFYQNEIALNVNPTDTTRNCTFLDNTLAFEGGVSSARASVYYSNFYQNDADTSNWVHKVCPNMDDPQFIDAPNGVFYLKPGSPLLTNGQEGALIGAYGRGFHTSKDQTVDEPPQGPPDPATPWRDWVDEVGNAFYAGASPPSTVVELDPSDQVILPAGVTLARIYSPVWDTQSEYTVVRSVDFAGFTDAATAHVIDADLGTPGRQIRVRTSLTTNFAQLPFAVEPGVEITTVAKFTRFKKQSRYVQVELVLNGDGG